MQTYIFLKMMTNLLIGVLFYTIQENDFFSIIYKKFDTENVLFYY